MLIQTIPTGESAMRRLSKRNLRIYIAFVPIALMQSQAQWKCSSDVVRYKGSVTQSNCICRSFRQTVVKLPPCGCHNWVMANLRRSFRAIMVTIAVGIVTSGCVPLGLTAAGVGMSTGVSHTLSGIVYKTFAAPQSKVQHATVAALRKMQIKVTETKRDENKELITARAADRGIDIEIEALTPNTTRITVVAKKDGGLIRDSATATEIILQTEKYVGTG